MPLLWLISQSINSDYDTYDSAVVCAATEVEAKRIHPNGGENTTENRPYSSWATPEHVSAVLIGVPATGIVEGAVICASFNAG